MQLQFREDLMSQSTEGRSYVKKACRPSAPVAADARFDQSQFHHLVKTNSKRACIVQCISPHSASVCCL